MVQPDQEMLQNEKLFTDPSTLLFKELQNCVWKIPNKQKATMKLKVLFLQTKAKLFGDLFFMHQAVWTLLCETPLADWPFHPAEQDRVTGYVTLQYHTYHAAYLSLMCVRYVRTHTCCHMFNSVMHMYWCLERVYPSMPKCVAVSSEVWPHSTYYTPAGPVCFPQWGLTTSWGGNSPRQVLGFIVQTWLPLWVLKVWASKPKVSVWVLVSQSLGQNT